MWKFSKVIPGCLRSPFEKPWSKVVTCLLAQVKLDRLETARVNTFSVGKRLFSNLNHPAIQTQLFYFY